MKQLCIGLAALASVGCVTNLPPLSEPNLPEASRLNTRLGIDYMQNGRLNLAQEKLERAVEQDDQNGVAHSFLAYIASRQGDAKLAEKHYRRALSLDAENPDTLNNFGVFLCSQERRQEAESYFLRAARAPRYVRQEAALANAGVCLRATAPERAEAYLREALDKNPQFPDALAQMASISMERGDYLRARAFLQRYENVAPHIAETLWMGVQTERELGDHEAQRNYAVELRKNFPDSREARNLESKL